MLVYDIAIVVLAMVVHGGVYMVRCRLAGVRGADARSEIREEQAFAQRSRQWLRDRIENQMVFVYCTGGYDPEGNLLVTLFRSVEGALTYECNPHDSENYAALWADMAYAVNDEPAHPPPLRFWQWYRPSPELS